MNKLLTANFIRLKKSKIFWLCIVFMFGSGIELVFTHYRNLQRGLNVHLDNSVFAFLFMIGITEAAFCSLFAGTEYSDGTIRNKIVIGHARTDIYFSHLITCSVSGIFMCFAFLIPYLGFGTAIIGWLKMGLDDFLLFLLDALILSIAYTSIFTLISMLCQNKATTAVICIFLTLFLLFIGYYIQAVLTSSYLGEMKREIYEFLNDFLPGGQVFQIGYMSPNKFEILAVYSGIIIILTTGTGIFFFIKKDLK